MFWCLGMSISAFINTKVSDSPRFFFKYFIINIVIIGLGGFRFPSGHGVQRFIYLKNINQQIASVRGLTYRF